MLAGAVLGTVPSAEAAKHPRVLLDKPTLKKLRADGRRGTREWKALKAFCDGYRPGAVELPDGEQYPDNGGIGEGYQGDGYLPAVYALGICFHTTGKDRYGRVGAELTSKMATTGAHAAPPERDSGYGIRNYGSGMALGYDWFHGQLDAATRARVRQVLRRWIRTYEREGFGRDHPQGNYYAGYYAATALAAIATDGDPDQPITWRRWLKKIHRPLARYYQRNVRGGGWPEGWNYGPLGVFNQSLPVLAARSAKGLNLTRGYKFPLTSGEFLPHFTWPDLRTMDDSDTVFENDNPSGVASWLFRAQAGVLGRFGDKFAPFLRSYADAVRRRGGGAALGATWDAWIEFLFAGGKKRDYRKLGLSYFARGMDVAAMRSSWKRDAVWAAFNAGPFTNNPDAGHEYFDKGSLVITQGGTPFLVNAWGSLMRNTPGTNDGSQFFQLAFDDTFASEGARAIYNVFYVDRPEPLGQTSGLRSDGAKTAMAAFEDRGGSAYMRAVKLEDQYPRVGKGTIKSWTREVVYVRPGTFVVRDRTSVTDASIDQWLAFHFDERPEPVGTGAVSTYETAQGRAFVLQPASHTEKVVDVFDGGKAFRLEIRGGSGATRDWLTAFQAGPSTGGATAIDGAQGAFVGGTAVIFAGGDGATYQAPAGAQKHVVAGLRPRTSYTITAAGSTIRIARGDGVAATKAGVLRFDAP